MRAFMLMSLSGTNLGCKKKVSGNMRVRVWRLVAVVLLFVSINSSKAVGEVDQPWPLANCGNQCYMNSFLQALLVLDPVIARVGSMSEADLAAIPVPYQEFWVFARMVTGMTQKRLQSERGIKQVSFDGLYRLMHANFIESASQVVFPNEFRMEQDVGDFMYGFMSLPSMEGIKSLFDAKIQNSLICPKPEENEGPQALDKSLWQAILKNWDEGYKQIKSNIENLVIPLSLGLGAEPFGVDIIQQSLNAYWREKVDYNPLSDSGIKNFSMFCQKSKRLMAKPSIFSFLLTVPRGDEKRDPVVKVPFVLSLEGQPYRLKSFLLRPTGHYVACVYRGGFWWVCDDEHIEKIQGDFDGTYFPGEFMENKPYRYQDLQGKAVNEIGQVRQSVDRAAYLFFYQKSDVAPSAFEWKASAVEAKYFQELLYQQKQQEEKARTLLGPVPSAEHKQPVAALSQALNDLTLALNKLSGVLHKK